MTAPLCLYLLEPIDPGTPSWRHTLSSDPQLAFAHSESEARTLVDIALLTLVEVDRSTTATPVSPWSQAALVRVTRLREAWLQEQSGGARAVVVTGAAE